MNEKIEMHLKDRFAEVANLMPENEHLANAVIARARHGQRRRVAFMSGIAASALGITLVSADVAGLGLTPQDTATITSAGASHQRTGQVPDAPLADCEPPRSSSDIGRRSFGFDGTVISITTPSSTSENSPLRYATVAFKVNEWFKGGEAKSTAVIMAAPLASREIRGESGPAYEVGSRLLVSGERRGDSLVAWGCGYTLYYSSTTATSWRTAF